MNEGKSVKELSATSVAITDNLEVNISKAMYKQGKGENGDWTCYEVWFKDLEGNILIQKIFRPKLTALSRASFARTLKSIIDCLNGEGYWNKISRFNSWNEFDTFIIDTLSTHIGQKVFIKTLVEKDYFDPSKMVACLPVDGFISKDKNLFYTNLEKNQVQDFYIYTAPSKNPNRHFN